MNMHHQVWHRQQRSPEVTVAQVGLRCHPLPRNQDLESGDSGIRTDLHTDSLCVPAGTRPQIHSEHPPTTCGLMYHPAQSYGASGCRSHRTGSIHLHASQNKHHLLSKGPLTRTCRHSPSPPRGLPETNRSPWSPCSLHPSKWREVASWSFSFSSLTPCPPVWTRPNLCCGPPFPGFQ